MKPRMCWLLLTPLVYWLDAPLACARSIKLVSPRSNETWTVGSQHCILWKSAGSRATDVVKLRYSLDGGLRWLTIAEQAASSGRFLWEIPDTVSADCRLEISLSAPRDTARAQFVIAATQKVADYEWTKVTDKAAFAPRDGAGALVYNDRMWLLGGWNPDDRVHFPRICNNKVWSSQDGVAWTLVKPNTFRSGGFDATRDWEGRHTAGYVVYKSRMWIVGGDANQGHYQNDVWSSRDGQRWTFVNSGHPVPWKPRALHCTTRSCLPTRSG